MEHDEFVEDLNEIKDAESEKERLLEKARKESEKTVSDALAQAKKTVEKASLKLSIELILDQKIEEEILAKARSELEGEEKKILAKAHKQAQEISSMNVPAAAVKKAVESIME